MISTEEVDAGTAFVSGAGSGIGRAVALAFAGSGAAVIACDADAPALDTVVAELDRHDVPSRPVVVDVTDADALADALTAAERGLPPLRSAFNGAGVEGPLARVEKVSPRDWHRTLAINVTGVWNCMRLQLPRMHTAGNGSIVNCASVFGLVGSRGGSAYAASKHAVVGLTRSAALENAARGVRVNAVCPGLTDTPMLDRLDAANPRFRDNALALSPAGRLVTPGEIADSVLWLCSGAARAITGQCLPIDDGMTAG